MLNAIQPPVVPVKPAVSRGASAATSRGGLVQTDLRELFGRQSSQSQQSFSEQLSQSQHSQHSQLTTDMEF